jgi:hypothetical protein
LTRFDEQGNPTFRCTPRELIHYQAGLAAMSQEDTTKDGYADRRQILEGGVPLRLEADTNRDQRPDVWITYTGGRATIQDEDTNFDGRIDQRFDLATEKAVPLNGSPEPPSLAAFDRIRCREFSDFWRR